MALISMAVWDTEQNKRYEMTQKCLSSLFATVDFKKHRLIVVDNGSIAETGYLLTRFQSVQRLHYIPLRENIGTAKAVNIAWQMRRPGENCIKMDSDIVITDNNWVDKLEACIARDPQIGIIGLKRKDLIERTDHPDPHWKSELKQLPHTPGQQWFTVEKVQHCMGSCQMYSSAFLDKVGYLVQWGKYGFDDSLMAYRAMATGFYSCFLCNVDIDHIDPGDTQYQKDKEAAAANFQPVFSDFRDRLIAGTLSPYFGPDVDLAEVH